MKKGWENIASGNRKKELWKGTGGTTACISFCFRQWCLSGFLLCTHVRVTDGISGIILGKVGILAARG